MNFARQILLFLSTVPFAIPPPARAQPIDHTGTDFWLAALERQNRAGQQPANPAWNLLITSEGDGDIDVTLEGDQDNEESVLVEAGETGRLGVPTGHAKNGIRATAGSSVAIYVLDYIGNNRVESGYLGLPVDGLGTEYVVINRTDNVPQVVVVATRNDTAVTITRPDVGIDPIHTRLERGEPFVLSNQDTDLTGTYIVSNHPVAVFSGSDCSPSQGPSCDPFIEQLPSVSSWGNNFLTLPLANSDASVIRLVASDNDTKVVITEFDMSGGNETAPVSHSLSFGQYYEVAITGASEISADKPILVAQFAVGSAGEPPASMILIPPVERYLSKYVTTTPLLNPGNQTSHFLNIIVPEEVVDVSGGDLSSLSIDGTALSRDEFEPIGSSGYFGARHSLAEGRHELESPSPFAVLVYGIHQPTNRDMNRYYGYSAGQALSPIGQVVNLSLTPAAGELTVGDTHCLEATVLDIQNVPVEGVSVNFEIDGANSRSASVETGSEGSAMFCYVGTRPGVDRVVASVESQTATATVRWRLIMADLQITQSDGVRAATPDQEISYTITVQNRGPMAVEGASVKDDFPGLSCTWTCRSEGGATCGEADHDESTRTLTLEDRVDLPVGGQVVYEAKCLFTSPEACGPLRNEARVIPPTAVRDLNPANNQALDFTDLPLCLVQTPSVVRALPGIRYDYHLEVGNEKHSAVGGVRISDVLNGDFVVEADDCGGRVEDGTWSWNVGSLAGRTAAHCALAVRLDICCVPVPNVATADADSLLPGRSMVLINEDMNGVLGGDFEFGLAEHPATGEPDNPYWREGSNVFPTPICTVEDEERPESSCGDGPDAGGSPTAGPRHPGEGDRWWAWFGGAPAAMRERSSLEQTILIPADRPVLSFWLWNGARSGAGDALQVFLDDGEQPIVHVVEGDPAFVDGYAEISCDLEAFAGLERHVLRFQYEPAERAVPPPGVTNFSVDDVSFVAKGEQGPGSDRCWARRRP